MRKVMLMIVAVVALFEAGCKKCPPCKEPSPSPVVTSLAPPATGFTRYRVLMRITGMVVLNTKRDDDPFVLLVPEVPGHEPFIYSHENFQMTSPIGRTILREPIAVPKYNVMLLEKEELSFATMPNEPSLAYTLQGGECPPALNDMGSLRWAPSFSEVLNRPVAINPDYLLPNPKAKIHARMSIEKGKLYSQPFDWYIWEFRNPPSGNPHKQMITGAVIYEFTVDLPTANPIFIVKRRAFGANTLEDLAALSPHNGNISFTVGITLKDQRLPGTSVSADVDDHFPYYYDLLDPNTMKDAQGNPITAVTKPYRTADFCFSPSTSLINCGPSRP